MPDERLEYPENVLPRLRYRFCPMCRGALGRKVIYDDGIERVACPACGWVHQPSNVMGVNVVIVHEGGVVALLPPDEPGEAPAGLPSGHVEYGESPEEAAVREAKEETGLDVEIVRCLGWHFHRLTAYPGPILGVMYETRSLGGELRGSEEGNVRVYPLEEFPQISPNRGGSQMAMEAFRRVRAGEKLLNSAKGDET